MEVQRSRRCCHAVLLSIVFGICLALAPSASALTLPPNFREDVIFSGLTQPVAVAFSPDGRVFVAEKSGIIKVHTSLSDTSPDVVADLRTQVHDFWDRGLLGMALHPNFPATNALYVLYTYDAPPGGTAPVFNDNCADATDAGCVVTGAAVAAHEHRRRTVRRLGAGAHPRLVPTVSEPLDRQPHIRVRRRALRKRRRRRQLHVHRLWTEGQPRAAIRRGASSRAPSAEGGALRSQDLRTSGIPRPWTARSCVWIRQQAQGFRIIRWHRAPMRTPAASSRTGSATRSG